MGRRPRSTPGAGEFVFIVGGPLGGLAVWSRSSGDDNGPGDDPSPDDDGDPPEWDPTVRAAVRASTEDDD